MTVVQTWQEACIGPYNGHLSAPPGGKLHMWAAQTQIQPQIPNLIQCFAPSHYRLLFLFISWICIQPHSLLYLISMLQPSYFLVVLKRGFSRFQIEASQGFWRFEIGRSISWTLPLKRPYIRHLGTAMPVNDTGSRLQYLYEKFFLQCVYAVWVWNKPID